MLEETQLDMGPVQRVTQLKQFIVLNVHPQAPRDTDFSQRWRSEDIPYEVKEYVKVAKGNSWILWISVVGG